MSDFTSSPWPPSSRDDRPRRRGHVDHVETAPGRLRDGETSRQGLHSDDMDGEGQAAHHRRDMDVLIRADQKKLFMFDASDRLEWCSTSPWTWQARSGGAETDARHDEDDRQGHATDETQKVGSWNARK